uniref:Uncharacterized protein LOC111114495 isoform X2 n=1 Tax=Crassostrea virginica TaxID=6565 RepID=A0A8B8BYR4_CRAVI|nr:uncharacterized protein LOC111114495 isoform X2 [Crassostrea virginica]
MRKTDFCPRSMTELENATKALGCSSDIYGNNQYMCLPNAEKTSLVEFCFDGLMGMKEKGYCLEVYEGSLTTKSCENFLFGCPNEPWRNYEFYKYPACQAINIRDKCYRLDPSCSTDNNGINESNVEVSKIQDPIVIYSVLGAVIILLITIIVILLWERNTLKKDRTPIHVCHEDADPNIVGGSEMLDEFIVRTIKRNDTETSIESFVQEECDDLASAASKTR